MRWTVWDPAGGETLRVHDLLASADEAGRRALETAVAFHGYRVAARSLAVQALEASYFPESPPRVPARSDGLGGIDVLVGIALDEPNFVSDLLPHGMSARAAEALSQRRALVVPKGSSGMSVRLAETFARAWSWNRRIGAWPPIDRMVLLGSLTFDELDVLAEWDAGYEAGDHTRGEIAQAVWQRIHESAFEDVPATYLERGDELQQLDAIMARHRSAFIVGREGSGRVALALAWLARLRCGDIGRVMDDFWGTSHVRGTFEPGPSRWRRCPPDRELIEALYVGDRLDIDEVDHQKRCVVVTTSEQLAAARALLDPQHEFGTLELPPVEEQHRLPIWLCATQGVPDALKRCLQVFGDAHLELPEIPWSPWTADGRRLDGWFEWTPLAPESVKPRPWTRKSIKTGHVVPPPSPTDKRWRPLDRFVPAGDLRALIELEQRLSTPVAID